MKRLTTAICLILLLNTAATASDVFRMKASAGTSLETVNIEKQFEKNESFSPFFSKAAITGLSITGSFEKTSDEYLVRVLLKDVKGKEYLVMESYEEICDKSSKAFTDYCEETIMLEGIVPDSIKVFVRDATVKIESISCQYTSHDNMLRGNAFKAAKAELKKKQVEEVTRKINEYNATHGKIWIAGVTDIALADYTSRQAMIGCPDNCPSGGFEYYVDGFFEIGKQSPNASSKTVQRTASNIVSAFDWRNRHGRDWTTPVKNQGGSRCCVAFAGVSCLEALVNLYYNQILDMDLSEWELACHGGVGIGNSPYEEGVSPNTAISYLVNTGIGSEYYNRFPNSLNVPNSLNNPDTLVSINGGTLLSNLSDEDIIKESLIHYGPLGSGFLRKAYDPSVYNNVLNSEGHAMALIAFDTIKGNEDSIYSSVIGGLELLHNLANYIGRTYWVFKNSYYTHQFPKIIFNDYSLMAGPFIFETPIRIKDKYGNNIYTESDIICEDQDGDGYYFWGIGQKPSDAPSWIPDEPDCDDSDYGTGPTGNVIEQGIDLGSLKTSTVTINDAETYNTRRYLYRDIVIPSGSTLTIQNARVDLYGNVKIIVQNNGQLIVDGGTLRNAEIALQAGSRLKIQHNGMIYMRQGKNLDAPLGSIVDIANGNILSETHYPN